MTIDFGGTCIDGYGPLRGDACAAVSVVWDSTDLQDQRPRDHEGHRLPDGDVRRPAENRWWLCSSRLPPTHDARPSVLSPLVRSPLAAAILLASWAAPGANRRPPPRRAPPPPPRSRPAKRQPPLARPRCQRGRGCRFVASRFLRGRIVVRMARHHRVPAARTDRARQEGGGHRLSGLGARQESHGRSCADDGGAPVSVEPGRRSEGAAETADAGGGTGAVRRDRGARRHRGHDARSGAARKGGRRDSRGPSECGRGDRQRALAPDTGSAASRPGVRQVAGGPGAGRGARGAGVARGCATATRRRAATRPGTHRDRATRTAGATSWQLAEGAALVVQVAETRHQR